MNTKVVNIRHIGRRGPNHVYIGRAGRGESGYYGNPVAIGRTCPVCRGVHKNGGDTLRCYAKDLQRRLEKEEGFAENVSKLKGKTLVCFCKPAPCHGDVLAYVADHGELPKELR